MEGSGSIDHTQLRIRCSKTLKRRFKVLCAREGLRYKDMLKKLLDRYAPDIEMG